MPILVHIEGTDGTIRVLKNEHKRILEILAVLEKKIMSADLDTELEEYKLLFLLGEHNMKEEMLLYPLIEGTIDDGQVQELFQKMDALATQIR
jgi:hemerythrin-like domain-containing protein